MYSIRELTNFKKTKVFNKCFAESAIAAVDSPIFNLKFEKIFYLALLGSINSVNTKMCSMDIPIG